MPALTSAQRKLLDDACVKGRRASDRSVRAALSSLSVTTERPPAHLGEDDRELRRGLRAKARQLGDTGESLDLLIAECAYEQWHRLLFARFLAENNLLIHPDYRAPVTLEDCEELASDLGEPDGWAVAGRFAAQILPGIFRLSDPCVQLRLAPEGRLALEDIVANLPQDVFTGDDALGWVYQFWQSEQKDLVNDAQRKIGGPDLGPVTQLFTEHYMVQFLLQNSLGAWWAARHPESSLLSAWSYLRWDAAGTPAAGDFDGWPSTVAEISVMDPCCGSGHFLVESFGMLWRMRAEEEGLDVATAQDAVLRDNLFGVELDPRCVQIAIFSLALTAWRAGGGWRELPVPRVACSGIPTRSTVDEWLGLAGESRQLKNALVRLQILFREADTLGSLVDPRRVVELTDPTGLQRSFEDVEWADVAPVLEGLLISDARDPAAAVLGADAIGTARAAELLARDYTLLVTNVPYLARRNQGSVLKEYCERYLKSASANLATSMIARFRSGSSTATTLALVSPQNWLYAGTYETFRREILANSHWHVLARLGPGAFRQISGEVVDVHLSVLTKRTLSAPRSSVGIDAQGGDSIELKEQVLRHGPLLGWSQAESLARVGAVIRLDGATDSALLAEYAEAKQGLATGDDPRHKLCFWEVPRLLDGWHRHQSSVDQTAHFGGCELIVNYGYLVDHPEGAALRGVDVWGRRGVSVRQTRPFHCSIYQGVAFDMNAAAIVPKREEDLAALWEFCKSEEYRAALVAVDPSLKVTNATLVKVPCDIDRWRAAALDSYPDGLPDPSSDDPTQWLFDGVPSSASEPLHAGVGRLVGYRWPAQSTTDGLDELADEDGIVCLPSVRGERTAAERLQELLARGFGGTWTPARTQELLAASGSKRRDLDGWLREDFFKSHSQLFKNRPFVWQIWDGRKDGFSALVNYHKLDRTTLEKLTYSYLGDWIERQVAGVRDDIAGAEERLASARTLQQTLELIGEGEPPYDIYVRWKSLARQPMGWEPDLNDGVRLNVRPFVEAGVLRAKFNVKWDKDRGKNLDGSERLNDLHYTRAQKQAARRGRA